MSSNRHPGTVGPEETRNQDSNTPEETRSYPQGRTLENPTRDNRSLHVTPDTRTSTSPSPANSSQTDEAAQPSLTTINSDPDGPWLKKSLLTLDGGGVRGYSSLIILAALMEMVATLEKEKDPNATHSVYPLQQRYREPFQELNPLIAQQPQQNRAPPLRRNKTYLAKVGSEASPSPYLPCHYFDYIVGTSTGGLTAIMLGRLSMSVEECLQAYEGLANHIFGHSRRFHIRKPPFIPPRPKYDSTRLANIIKDIVRKQHPQGRADTLFGQPHQDMCRTVVIAWKSFELGRVRVPYLFRSYYHPKSTDDDPLERNPGHQPNYPIWQVGMATSAAPSYFESVKLDEDGQSEFIDGGFGANNPSEEAYRTVKQLFSNDMESIQLMVSIGTGKNQEAGRNPSRGYSKYLFLLNAAAKWATDSEHTHHSVRDALRNTAAYYRLNVEHGLGKMKLDTWKGENGAETLGLIRGKTREYLATADAQRWLRASAEHLVNIRRSRAYQLDQDRWERFCHGVEYRCSIARCGHGDRVFLQRRDLKLHLEETHAANCLPDENEAMLERGKRWPLFPLVTPPPPPPRATTI